MFEYLLGHPQSLEWKPAKQVENANRIGPSLSVKSLVINTIMKCILSGNHLICNIILNHGNILADLTRYKNRTLVQWLGPNLTVDHIFMVLGCETLSRIWHYRIETSVDGSCVHHTDASIHLMKLAPCCAALNICHVWGKMESSLRHIFHIIGPLSSTTSGGCTSQIIRGLDI